VNDMAAPSAHAQPRSSHRGVVVGVRAVMAWMALVLQGCDGEAAQVQPLAPPPWQGADGSSGNATEVEHYAVWQVSTVENQDPSPLGEGAWAEQRTVTLALAQVTWQGQTGKRVQQVCAVHTNPAFGTQLTYGTKFVNTIPAVTATLQRNGATWTQEPAVLCLGLPSGYDGALPQLGEGGHSAVRDTDNDGQPGVTLELSHTLLGSQQLYVAQRERVQWQATVAANGEIVTEPEVLRDQVTLGASLDLLVMATQSRPAAGKPAETLRWVPVPATMDCATLLQQTSKWLGSSWPPG
jgi:hypothetical protein